MSLRKVEQSDADRPQYLWNRYRPCAGVEAMVTEERDERVDALRPPTRTYGLAATNRFSVSRSSRSGSAAGPFVGGVTGAHEHIQSAV